MITRDDILDKYGYINGLGIKVLKCEICPLYKLKIDCCEGEYDTFDNCVDTVLYWENEVKTRGMQAPQEPTVDMVNRPPHYCREGGMECIDEMIILYGIEEVKSFCKLNAHKYRYRTAAKNGEEDLKKSDWYIRKYKELCELGDTNG